MYLGSTTGRRPAAKIDGIKRLACNLLAAHLNFLEKTRHIRLSNVRAVAEGHKIAVTALLFAERNMKIDSCHIILSRDTFQDRRIRL